MQLLSEGKRNSPNLILEQFSSDYDDHPDDLRC